jgi:hypothetical protein
MAREGRDLVTHCTVRMKAAQVSKYNQRDADQKPMKVMTIRAGLDTRYEAGAMYCMALKIKTTILAAFVWDPHFVSQFVHLMHSSSDKRTSIQVGYCQTAKLHHMVLQFGDYSEPS